MSRPWNLSYAISTAPTSFKAVGQGDWKDVIGLAASLGYEGIELAIRDPKAIDIKELGSLLKRGGLMLAATGTGQAYLDENISLSDPDISVRSEAVRRLKDHVDFAAVFGNHILIGLIKGKLGNDPDERKVRFSYFNDAFREAVDYAHEKDVSVLVEPINRYECDFFNTLDEVLGFVSGLGCKNLGVLLDTFHMNIEERDTGAAIHKARHLLRHFHIADSNRRFPTEGHVDFRRTLKDLKKEAYTGFLSGEMLPWPDLQGSMKSYIKKMDELFDSVKEVFV